LTRIPASPSSIPVTPPVQAERRRTAGLLAAVAVSLWALGGLPAAAFEGGRVSPSWQPAAAGTRAAATRLAAEQPAAPSTRPGVEAAAETPRAERGEGETGHSESPWGWVARLFNFAILIAGLVYLLRSPLLAHLDQRGVDVRSALTRAAGLRAEAGSQVAQIDARMKALPAEIEALKRRGAEEIAAEEARIRALAESERQRLLDQARRGIETELRVAERDLKKRAGELAVALATERVKRTIGEQDQARLVDRYVAQMRH
jgi:F0F1-type ATP synthase membrane subunit b/b'